jgi:hypothetical protein
MTAHLRVLAPLLVASVLLAGCMSKKDETALVKGKVTYRDKPVPNGTLNFFPAEGPSAYTEIKPDGTYELRAIRGKHRVVVVAMQDTASSLPEQRAALPPPIVPNKYTALTTTDLVAEVKDEPNNIDFVLKDD